MPFFVSNQKILFLLNRVPIFMKKNRSAKLSFKKTHALLLALIFSAYTSSSFSRTLIFQSDSERNLTKQSVSKQVASSGAGSASNELSTGNQVSVPLASSANSELFFMIEQLQQEVNSLRGLLEEQGYELRMLKQSSKDRYLDLDTRVLDLTKRLSGTGSSSIVNSKKDMDSQSSSIEPVQAPLSSFNGTPKAQDRPVKIIAAAPIKEREPTKAETDDYQKAYAFIKNKQFDESVLALFAYTENYPDSPLLPNVYYWLGEVYLASSKFEQAKTSFSLVISAYPNSQKVSDSLYKLAVTVDALGDKALAKQYINDVQSRFPDSSAAKLASAYKVSE